MATLIGLPKLSPTMEEGVLAKWHRKVGDKISPGDIIAEVETDKANMDFPLEDEGTLLKLLVKEGDTVKLGAPVAILGEPGEDFSALEAQAGQQAAPVAEAPKAAPMDPGTEKKPAPPPPEAKAAPAQAPAPPTPPVAQAAPQSGRILASPLARALAAENGIDLRGMRGSGPEGRIVERDIRSIIDSGGNGAARSEEARPAEPPAPAPAPPPPSAPSEPGIDYVDTPVSMMRKTIARRLVESKTTVPHFYLTADCDAAPLGAFRAAMNVVAGEEKKVSVNDLVVKACALALRRVPAANASFLGDRIRRHGRVHIGVAVSIDDGLVTPVVRDADKKGLETIRAEIRDLAGRARNRKLHPDEMTGSTFTVSNLGMFGIDHFAAVINPPEGALVAVGKVRRVPVVDGDAIVIGERMALTLSCDHRVVDGALGAQLLAEIIRLVEHPAALAL